MTITHDELVTIARRWLSRPWRNVNNSGHGACSIIVTEIVTGAYENPDALGFYSGHLTVLIECKTSRSDFRADQKKVFRGTPALGMGRQRFYMAPKSLIAVDELPDGWGLIEVNNGKTRVVKASDFFERNLEAEMYVLTSLICRLKVENEGHAYIRRYSSAIDKKHEPKAGFIIQPDILDSDTESQ